MSSSAESESELLSQTNELLTSLARLNSNVQLYTQVNSLQKNLSALEENYKSLQNNIKTSTCNAQCEELNTTIDPNSVDDFLIQLLSYKSKSNPPPPTVPENTVVARAQFVEDGRASAPPLFEEDDEVRASAPPL
jgi:predicted nuclease with TOPRIM domain